MNKIKNKKGFTLIELMATIAIVAVLVSVVMPVFGESKNKANAATNAANLRGVESQLAVLLVSNPDVFDRDGLDEIYVQVGDFFDSGIQTIETAMEWTQSLLSAAERSPLANMSWIKKQIQEYKATIAVYQEEIVNTQAARDHALEQLTYTYTATNGVLHLNGVTIAAPTSKALDVDGLTLDEGVEMTVFVSDDKIYASYSGLLTSCFAIVADSGSGAAIADSAHEYSDVDRDRTCDICKDNSKHSSTEIDLYYITDNLD